MQVETIYTGIKSHDWDGAASPLFRPLWVLRAQVAATLIPEHSRVLDLGCGDGLIRDFLPEGCTWQGYDLKPNNEDVRQIDLDAGEFPGGDYDLVMLMGVLSWLKHPAPALRRAREAAPLILSNDAAPRSRLRRLLGRPLETKFAPLLRETGTRCQQRVRWAKDSQREYFVSLWT